MPGLDKTGPMGQGPMTGRGMGSCNQQLNPGRGMGLGLGRGFRGGRGRGRGCGFGMGRFAGMNQPDVNEHREGVAARIGQLEAELQQLKALNEDSNN